MQIPPNPKPNPKANERPVRKLPPTTSSGEKISYENWRALDGPVLKAFRALTSSVVGAGNGLGTALVGASAGGAHGIVYGAGLDPRLENLFTAANLAAIGAATANYAAIQPLNAAAQQAVGVGLGSAMTTARLGFSRWQKFPLSVQKEVRTTAEQWTDRLLPEKGDSGPVARLARGAAGELAGASGGGLVGFLHGLREGRVVGRSWVDSIQRSIYKNMHGSSVD